MNESYGENNQSIGNSDISNVFPWYEELMFANNSLNQHGKRMVREIKKKKKNMKKRARIKIIIRHTKLMWKESMKDKTSEDFKNTAKDIKNMVCIFY